MKYPGKIERLLQLPPKRLLKKLMGFEEVYTIAIKPKGESIFNSIPYSSRYWYADPIVFQHGNADYLFAEAYDRKTGKGAIAVATMNEEPEEINFKVIIEEPYHMSFPMVFTWDQEIYMIPETCANFSINLYRAVDFPYKWECIKVFKVNAQIVDTVFLKGAGDRLYMLASEINPEAPLEVRYQKFALGFRNGQWSLEWDEAFNKQQTYNLSDRNAGTCIVKENRMILPTQVSTQIDYGVKIVFREWKDNEWQIKSTMAPADVVIKGIPRETIIGIHTYACTERREIIDVRYQKFSPIIQWKKLGRRICRSV